MAIENNYGAYNIANNTVEYNPQRLNNFNLVIEDIDGILRTGSIEGSTSAEDIIRNAQEEVMIALRSCDPPNVSQNKINIQKGNSTIKFPGKPEFADINLSFYDFIGSNAKDVFLAWQNLSYNRRYDYIGNKSSYKKNCTLYEFTPAGEVVRYWEIKGAWPTSVQLPTFDATSDEEAVINATLSIDWADMHMPDEL